MAIREVDVTFDDGIVRQFVWASIFWGVIGMMVGVLIATQLAFFQANFHTPWLTFGRLRPLHTNAVIFAFVGNMLFAGIYYSMQRLLKTRMASDKLSAIHFWGWQLIIVAAAITLPLGMTQSKEYAELEWPIDIAVAVVWVIFAINFFWTIVIRRERTMYVAIWFYISTVVTIPILYIINNLALPIADGVKSYSVFAGVQDALVQWWYGHNAVAFFLTTPILGIMYYFIPKAANRPIYSYRLSIIHFWSLVFLYIWAGPHHLLNTALPAWAQSMGMVFSLMLWAPSWGGMVNGLLTLRGAWHKLREDPVIKFFIAGVTFYGMATFEGPLLSIKSISALAHYTDWIVGHVHSGALGWNGFMAAGMFYFLVPRLFGTELYKKSWADAHFWVGTFGILLYMAAMWVSGITQGLMWKATTEDGTLMYSNFVETLIAIKPMYIMRLVGGSLYLLGFMLMVVNLLITALRGKAVNITIKVAETACEDEEEHSNLLLSKEIVVLAILLISMCLFLFADLTIAVVLVSILIACGLVLYTYAQFSEGDNRLHHLLEGKALTFTWLVVLVVLVGGVVEIIPSLMGNSTLKANSPIKPYNALQVVGRDIYVREGCYNCHSQMIRPFLSEELRYGAHSKAEEFVFDHPFQWGSKRTGPDLHRVGGKYPNLWHYQHFVDPRVISPGSNMPSYRWLREQLFNIDTVSQRMRALQVVGVPYQESDIRNAKEDIREQAEVVVKDLKAQGVQIDWNSEMVALIAYMQSMGKLGAK